MMLLPVLLTGPMFLLGGLSLVPCSFGGCLCLGDQGGLSRGVSVWGSMSRGISWQGGGVLCQGDPPIR